MIATLIQQVEHTKRRVTLCKRNILERVGTMYVLMEITFHNYPLLCIFDNFHAGISSNILHWPLLHQFDKVTISPRSKKQNFLVKYQDYNCAPIQQSVSQCKAIFINSSVQQDNCGIKNWSNAVNHKKGW